ncbi:hypothetical protein [Brenneria goodwinii]|uniref:hypothetical protein n=1 Tax=Brenneria goodwinii TaxID=1109412 RepID=UPI0036EB8F4A
MKRKIIRLIFGSIISVFILCIANQFDFFYLNQDISIAVIVIASMIATDLILSMMDFFYKKEG